MSDQTIGVLPAGVASIPTQRVPLRSSDARMHVLDEACWCGPNVLMEGGVITAVDHRTPDSGERDHVHDGTGCWCGPTVESFG